MEELQYAVAKKFEVTVHYLVSTPARTHGVEGMDAVLDVQPTGDLLH
jgi:hypothetical protein